MDLRFFIGALTLTPAVAALLVAALGLAHRPVRRFALGLGIAGVAIPLLCLIYLALDLFAGVPLRLALFGLSTRDWFSPALRVDPLGVYAAFGVAVVVAPLLLWMAWRDTVSPATAEGGGAEATEAGNGEPASAEGAESAPTRPERGDWTQDFVPAERWVAVALALGFESAALTLGFADNLLLLGLAWIALAALAWGLGEIGSAAGEFDRLSLALMLAGPVLTVAVMLFVVGPGGSFRVSDLMGVGNVSLWVALLAGLTLALAAGIYPFLGWVRRRAIVTPAAGFAAVMLGVLPAALFVGGRVYASMQDPNGLWPQIGAATPPITIGIVAVLSGALTVAICGLLALGRREGRALVALLAVAQVGWGFVALGLGRPLSIAALVALLATSLLGLGAMIAALFAGGMLTGDIEPEGAGPRPAGAPLRPLNLIAWGLGAAALVGAPPFAGFVARHLMSAASLGAAQLSIPLVGLAWVGDALLALAVLRATAPALASTPADFGKESPGEEAAETTDAAEGEDDAGDEAEEAEDEAEALPSRGAPMWRERLAGVSVSELPGLALALVALLIGIAPGLLLQFGSLGAAKSLLPAGVLDSALRIMPLGYSAGATQWLPGLAWIALAAVGALLALATRFAPRGVRPVYLAGQPAAGTEAAAGEAAPWPVTEAEADVEAEEARPEGEEPAEAMAAEDEAGDEAGDEAADLGTGELAEPEDAWQELRPAFHSAWTTPGAEWLLRGLEGEADEAEDEAEDADEAEDEMSEDAEASEEEANRDGTSDGGDSPTSSSRRTDDAARRGAAEGTGDQG